LLLCSYIPFGYRRKINASSKRCWLYYIWLNKDTGNIKKRFNFPFFVSFLKQSFEPSGTRCPNVIKPFYLANFADPAKIYLNQMQEFQTQVYFTYFVFRNLRNQTALERIEKNEPNPICKSFRCLLRCLALIC